MSDTISQAKEARAILADALNALQADASIPDELLAVASPIAQAMGALHAIERTGDLSTAVKARSYVREALNLLQKQTSDHQAVSQATEAVASSLGTVFSLAKRAENQPTAQAPVHQPAPAPQAEQPTYTPPADSPSPQYQPPAPAYSAPAAHHAPTASPGGGFQHQPGPAASYSPSNPGSAPSFASASPAPGPAPSFSSPSPAVFPNVDPGPAAVAGPPPTFSQPAHHQPAIPAHLQPAPQATPQPTPQAVQQPAPQATPAYRSLGQTMPMRPADASAPQPGTGSPFRSPSQQEFPPPMPGAVAPQAEPGPSPYVPAGGGFSQPAAHNHPAAPPEPGPSPMGASPTFRSPSSQSTTAPAGAPPAARPSGTIARFEAALGVNSTSNFYKGLSGNDVVEHGGLFIATYNKLPPLGSRVLLKVTLPGGYEFEAEAEVGWTRESRAGEFSDVSPGFGARFTEISDASKQLIYRYVRHREPLFHDDF
jgi:hypothetical protein